MANSAVIADNIFIALARLRGLKGEFDACSTQGFPYDPFAAKDIPAIKKHYDELIDELHRYFKSRNFILAEACLDLILKKKGAKMRKDGLRPDYAHEIVLAISALSMVKDGLIPENNKKLGSVEELFCTIFTHDLGEDFQFFKANLEGELWQRLIPVIHDENSPYYGEMIKRLSDNMALLTHYRKFTEEQMINLIGFYEESADPDIVPPYKDHIPELKKLKNTDDIILLPKIGEYLKHVFPTPFNSDKMQVFALLKAPKKETGKDPVPVIIFTQHGFSNGMPGVDWNSYINVLKEFPYLLLTKFLDTNEGLSSFLARGDFSVHDYATYLDTREQLFSITPRTRHMGEKYKPLQKAFDSVDGMMGALYTIGRNIVNHHPATNKPGGKGLDPESSFHIDFQDYLVRGLRGYKHVSYLDHPLGVNMRQFGEISKTIQGFPALYQTTRNSLLRQAEYWNILKLTNPPPEAPLADNTL